MTANELADYLDNNVEAMLMSEQIHIDQAAIMLRQQQAQIEALKEYMKAQDRHIVDLAFKLVYAERGNEVFKELSNERK